VRLVQPVFKVLLELKVAKVFKELKDHKVQLQ
jgi:hypothetical protein